MRLVELLSEKISLDKAIPIKLGGRDFRDLGHRFRGNQLGDEGHEAVAKETGTNVVTKSVRLKTIDDSFVTFLNIILANQDNPFFPKIHKAKLYEVKDNNFFPYGLIVQMEKLIPLNNPKISDSVLFLIQNLGIDLDKLASYVGYSGRVRNEMAIGILDDLLRNPDHSQVEQKLGESPNPKFVEAVNALRGPIHKEMFGKADLNSNNAMVRLTSTGPQLVITDPFVPLSMFWPD